MSVLVGVRSAVADKMELLFWDRKADGTYNNRGNVMKAYTRLLIVKIMLKNHVGHMGNEVRVAVCHLHHKPGNKNRGFCRKHDAFWKYLADKCRRYGVHVLIGDFNMSLFKVVPELRSRGVHAQLCSWFPWMSEEDHFLMSDSCGIFFLMPCAVKRHISLDMVEKEFDKLIKLPMNGGPGQTLNTKSKSNIAKIKDSMIPVPVAEEGEYEPGEYADAVAAPTTAQSAVADNKVFKVREKALDPNVWMYQGANHKGSHFPLCAFTNSEGRRSEERFVKRQERQRAKRSWKYPR